MLRSGQFPDIFVPKAWRITNEPLHEFGTLNAINHLDVYAV
jgi:hypothetical protein